VERCRECSGRRLAFVSARAAVCYRDGARPLVRAWKERGLRPFAPIAADLVVEVVPPPWGELVTFVPPDGDRSLRRGHHPAATLARELGRRWELEVAPLLRRTRPVSRQTGLALVDRRRNMRGAFGSAGPVRGGVVLVDDVYTTGATAGAAASALARAGASSVEVVTFARAVRN
jgi:predicted amidophosphoribosyltransferase